MDKNKNLISEVDAQNQIDIVIDFYDINASHEDLIKPFEDLLKHVRRGRVEISENEETGKPEVIQTLRTQVNDVKQLTYKVVGGTAKAEMKNSFKSDYEKIYALVGSLTEFGAAPIKRLDGVDLKVVECLGMIFLLL